MRRIALNLSSLKQNRPHEYAIRFVFGGLCTVLAGLIAKRYGPGMGGLFLAFPAIFPATATLIEDHEKKRKAKLASDGRIRGRMAASLDAAGASLGCIGLLAFALVLWKLLDRHNPYIVVASATVVWAITACVSWLIWSSVRRLK